MTMCVLPDGYIIACPGLFYSDARNNDAATLTCDLTEGISGLGEILREGDVVIVDRGYRDCVPYLEMLGLRPQMPSFISHGRQLTTEEANRSREITIHRWKVEGRNGHVKSVWKFCGKDLFVGDVPFAGDYFQIGCALINAYRPTILASYDTAEVGTLIKHKKTHEK